MWIDDLFDITNNLVGQVVSGIDAVAFGINPDDGLGVGLA